MAVLSIAVLLVSAVVVGGRGSGGSTGGSRRGSGGRRSWFGCGRARTDKMTAGYWSRVTRGAG